MSESSAAQHDRRAACRQAVRAVWVLLFAAALAACHRTPAEQQIREAIDAAAAAARADDTSGVLAVVSDDFTGNEGDLDRDGLRRLLALRALRQDKTGVLVGPVTFEHKGDRIVAKFNLVLTGGKPDDLLPDQSAIYAMTTAWRREGSHWRCYAAAWSNGSR
ncbi:MAG: hypothetical protein OJF55_000016 [Rhodanobacteraceae bacterium]|jgi:ketosteroid isomerase-like protein|nr:MAG: hypothetical protein OJF55_000016 [Rhodanobacteraceae bacterium]